MMIMMMNKKYQFIFIIFINLQLIHPSICFNIWKSIHSYINHHNNNFNNIPPNNINNYDYHYDNNYPHKSLISYINPNDTNSNYLVTNIGYHNNNNRNNKNKQKLWWMRIIRNNKINHNTNSQHYNQDNNLDHQHDNNQHQYHNRGLIVLLLPSLIIQLKILSIALPFVLNRLIQYLNPLSLFITCTIFNTNHHNYNYNYHNLGITCVKTCMLTSILIGGIIMIGKMSYY